MWPTVVGLFCGLPGLVRIVVWLAMENGLKPGPSGPLAVIMLVIAGFLWFGAWAHYLTTSLVITSKKLIFQQGVIRHKRLAISLQEVTAVDVFQGRLGEMLGYGSIVVHGPTVGGICFTLVPDPRRFRQQIEQQRSLVLQHLPMPLAA